jgi:hypothetical protein
MCLATGDVMREATDADIAACVRSRHGEALREVRSAFVWCVLAELGTDAHGTARAVAIEISPGLP